MLNNYQYFIKLAKKLNISNAAEELCISHQCLSKYLKNLEATHGVALFTRKPEFKLTHAGEILLETYQQIELAEQNVDAKLADIKDLKAGVVNLGITEGRYPIIIPPLLKRYAALYPKVNLNITNTTSPKMQALVLNNDLDLFISGLNNVTPNFKFTKIMDEKLYMVISDNLLKEHVPALSARKEYLTKGVDLRDFAEIPCILNKKGFSTRSMIDRHLAKIGSTLNCITELTQPDMQYLLSSQDIGMSFCLTMYLPGIEKLNSLKKLQNDTNLLNVFPIRDLTEVNSLGIIYNRYKIFPAYTKALYKLIKEICVEHQKME